MGEARKVAGKEVILEVHKRENNSPFCYAYGVRYLQNAELKLKYQKYESWAVLRGDIVKDD